MKTLLLKSSQIDEAVALLKKGEVVAIPTETVYGLAADATNSQAISKIFLAKGRPLDHPLIVHLDAFDKVIDFAEEIPASAKKLADHFWPGPLTMIFKKRKTVSNLITADLDTVALRIPNHDVTIELIKRLGTAVVAPSANAHKRTSPTKPEHVLKTLSGKISAIIDGGSCSIGLESTIIDMTKSIPTILRPGGITCSMIEDVLGFKIENKQKHKERVAGNMDVHYQPEKPLFLMSIDEITKQLEIDHNCAVLHYSLIVKAKYKNILFYKISENKVEYAQALYEALYAIDTKDIDKILVEIPPYLHEWSDVHDRLLKASSKVKNV